MFSGSETLKSVVRKRFGSGNVNESNGSAVSQSETHLTGTSEETVFQLKFCILNKSKQHHDYFALIMKFQYLTFHIVRGFEPRLCELVIFAVVVAQHHDVDVVMAKTREAFLDGVRVVIVKQVRTSDVMLWWILLHALGETFDIVAGTRFWGESELSFLNFLQLLENSLLRSFIPHQI